MNVSKHQSHSRGFSLIEITLALGIVGIVISSLLAIFTQGMSTGVDADRRTVVGLIMEDAIEQIKGKVLKVGFVDDLYYTLDGEPIQELTDGDAYYQVRINLVEPNSNGGNPSLDFSDVSGVGNQVGLLAAKMEIDWPVDPASGEVPNSTGPKKIWSFMVSTLAGPDWEEIDSSFEPKIEF